jgi:hypothetical protein
VIHNIMRNINEYCFVTDRCIPSDIIRDVYVFSDDILHPIFGDK